ncbi:MAG TPA: tRNA (guanosine(46)-N7)-methyltransferase TrmB [Rectinemataceae bacterium]
MAEGSGQRRIRSYVLRSGRMTEGQKRALAKAGPAYILPYSDSVQDIGSAFPSPAPIVLEIGFGMGQATWRIAQERPEYNYLGVEVHEAGVGRLVMELSSRSISNVRIIQHDAVEVMERMLAPSSLWGIHLFYPDPWPKKRHNKRRILRGEILDIMVSRLMPKGYFYFVTDIEDYALWGKDLLDGCSELENPYGGFAGRLAWRPETKFESKAKSARRPAFELFYSKKESSLL